MTPLFFRGSHQLSRRTSATADEMREWMRVDSCLGAQAYELFLPGQIPPAQDVHDMAVKNTLALAGCAVFFPDGANGNPFDTTKENQTIASFRSWIEYMEKANGMGIGGPLVAPLGSKLRPTKEHMKVTVPVFREVAKMLDGCGRVLSLEPLRKSEIAWPNTVEDVVQFILFLQGEGVDTTNIKVLYDLFHALREENNLVQSLAMLLVENLLGHMHGAGPSRNAPDITQHIPWTEVARLLIAAKWRGVFTIESFGKECDLPEEVTGPKDRLWPAADIVKAGMRTLLLAQTNA